MTTKFERNQAVLIRRHGREVRGSIVETGPMGKPMPFYPDSTVTKYGNGSMGRTAWGYRCRFPIVNKDGSLYLVNGREAMGIGYVESCDIN